MEAAVSREDPFQVNCSDSANREGYWPMYRLAMCIWMEPTVIFSVGLLPCDCDTRARGRKAPRYCDNANKYGVVWLQFLTSTSLILKMDVWTSLIGLLVSFLKLAPYIPLQGQRLQLRYPGGPWIVPGTLINTRGTKYYHAYRQMTRSCSNIL